MVSRVWKISSILVLCVIRVLFAVVILASRDWIVALVSSFMVSVWEVISGCVFSIVFILCSRLLVLRTESFAMFRALFAVDWASCAVLKTSVAFSMASLTLVMISLKVSWYFCAPVEMLLSWASSLASRSLRVLDI